jgi:hypothetical protein
VERENYSWHVNGIKMLIEEIVEINPETIAQRIRQEGIEIHRIGKFWKIDGEMVPAAKLIFWYSDSI